MIQNAGICAIWPDSGVQIAQKDERKKASFVLDAIYRAIQALKGYFIKKRKFCHHLPIHTKGDNNDKHNYKNVG